MQTATHGKKLDFHLDGCISDNWMRGSNSYLKRTRLVAPSKKVTITISPNQPLFTPWYSQCESASIDGPLCLIFSQRSDFLRAQAHKGLFFSMCSGSLLAAHRQYPLIKPVTLSLTVTLKKQTKVTLCFKNKDAHQRCLSVCFELSPFFCVTHVAAVFILSAGMQYSNELNALFFHLCGQKSWESFHTLWRIFTNTFRTLMYEERHVGHH